MVEPINLNDEDLIDLLKGDNELAYSVLYRKYNKLLFIYVYKKLKDEEEAKDIVQEVFFNLWKNRHRIKINTSVKSYLYQAVRLRALNVFVHKKVCDQFYNSIDRILISEKEADYTIREKDIQSIIEREIASMPPKMQAIFALSRKENLTHKEIAAVLGVAESTVTTQIKRALKRIKGRIIEFSVFIFL